MKRRLISVLALMVTSFGVTLVTAAPASADTTSIRCTTASYSVPDIHAVAGGQIKILGWAHATYIGSYAGFGGTYRIWHYTYQVNGGGTYYQGGAGVKCNSAGDELSDVDLTRETLTANDHPKCGTTSYDVGSNSYTYIGSRTTEGDRFRYWGQSVYGGTFYMRGPSAVRCD